MELVRVDKISRTVEISLSKQELMVIYGALANYEMGISKDEYKLFLNSEKEDVDKLFDDVNKIRDRFDQ